MYTQNDIMASKWTGLLPLHHRYFNGIHIPHGRKALRIREKFVILLIFMTFIAVCASAFMLLPNFQDKAAMKDVTITKGGGFLTSQKDDTYVDRGTDLHRDNGVDLHNIKANQEMPPNSERNLVQEINRKEINKQDHEDKPLKSKIQFEKERILKMQKKEEEERKFKEIEEEMKLNKDHNGYPGSIGGEPSDPVVKVKRDKVKEMMLHAWHGYEMYSWGANEHRPVSKRPHMGSIFGADSLGATIVDAADTLFIMELNNEYIKARDWIAHSLNFDTPEDVSVFETTIRFVGGLLSAYALTGDRVFKNKAKNIADKLLPAFNTPTGLPLAVVNVQNGYAHNYVWASSGSSILSEVGSLHLEFDYLSSITGDSIYRDKVMKIRTVLKDMEKPSGLYPNYISPRTGTWGQMHVSMGALGDSFYEYLLKEWLISNKEDTEARQMYDDAMKVVFERLLMKSNSGLTYFAEYKFGRLDHKMDHLACFSAGMVAMGAKGSDNFVKYMSIGEELAHTCHESYLRTATGLGPEAFHFEEAVEAKAIRYNEKYYILRPEVVEGWFYMWRLTKKQKYRDWAWDVVLALEANCRTEGGYSGIRDVYQVAPMKDDVQQSFFLAETLKYLYLIFSNDSLLPLDMWVFNTEAHPLPVKGIPPIFIANLLVV